MSFKWQLPQIGDQEVKGIMSYGFGFIFYKMYYVQNLQSLFYSAHNIHEFNTQITFVLTLENQENTYATPHHTSLNINSINDSIFLHNNIVIHKDVLDKFLDQNRYFILKFQIINDVQ